jgi:hypothetical protein
MINRRLLPAGAARRHEPRWVFVSALGRRLSEEITSPLLISSPGTRRDDLGEELAALFWLSHRYGNHTH